MKAFKKILFPIDFSESSKKVFPFALEMAQKFDAKLYLLFVATDISHLITTDLSRDLLKNAVAEIARSGETQMEAFCGKQLSGFPNHEAKVVTGSPSDEIVKFTEAEGIDLVVMGTHGRKGLDRTLMGSVADHVIKNASVPVLTINPFKAKAK
jgi:nucleotide-binding universal stress UspA family protein